MSRRRRQRRTRVVGARSRRLRLVVLAGFPASLAGAAKAGVEKAFEGTKVYVHVGRQSGELYDAKVVDELVVRIAQYTLGQVQQHQRNPSQPQAPRDISAVYVPCRSEAVLLSALDYFAWSQRIGAEKWRFARREAQWADVSGSVLESVADCHRALGSMVTSISRAKANPAQLPPRNFHLPSPELAMASVLGQVARRQLSFDEMSRIGRHGLVDDRGRTFQPDKGRHGLAREAADASVARRALNSVYRLGCPLPPGLHFDVQAPTRHGFVREPFYCCDDGDQVVTADYVNIYPNDKLRVPK